MKSDIDIIKLINESEILKEELVNKIRLEIDKLDLVPLLTDLVESNIQEWLDSADFFDTLTEKIFENAKFNITFKKEI